MTTESNVAVLIDYENVGLESIEYLLDQLSDIGRVIVKRAYADWSVHRNKRDQLLELGIEAAHHFRSTKSSKNSSDISLAIDAVDLLHNAPVDTFVIASADSDFVPLVSKLRAAGKIVMGAGRRDGSSPTLVKSCDRYIFLDEIKPVQAPRRTRPKTREDEVGSLIVRAVEAAMDNRGEVLGSKLYQTMLRIDPSFSFKVLGYRAFTQFLSTRSEVSVTRSDNASDVTVQLEGAAENGIAVSEGARRESASGGMPEPVRREPRRSDRRRREPARAEVARPDVPRPEIERPEPVRAEVARPDSARRENVQPDSRRQDIAQPEPMRPNIPQPEEVKPEEATPQVTGPTALWEREIDHRWDSRQSARISGQAAASDAAKALGVPKLKSSEYQTLDKLLAASEFLSAGWHRDGNAIIKN